MKRLAITLIALLACNPMNIEVEDNARSYRLQSGFNFAEKYGTDFWCYRSVINDTNTYAFNAAMHLQFIAAWGEFSPNIFDFDQSGTVATGDLTQELSGYGQQIIPPFLLHDIEVIQVFSSGWPAEVPGYIVAFVKPSVADEGGNYEPETLNSFWLELVNNEGVQERYYFYADN